MIFKKGKKEQLTKHFNLSEFECKCNDQYCRITIIDLRLTRSLEALRLLIDQPMIVNSGYRCNSHNKAVGGTVDSRHLQGQAADISTDTKSPEKITQFLRMAEILFGGIGTYKTFIHLDIREKKTRW